MQVKAIAIFMLAFVLLLAGCKQGGKAAYDRGMDCLEKGNNKQAVIEFTAVLRESPQEIGALCNRASAYDGLDDYPHAIQDFNAAIKLAETQDPGNQWTSELYYNRGVLYARYGHTAEAIRDYRKAIQIRPDIEDAHNNLAKLLATHPGATSEEGKEAVQFATKACKQTQWKDSPCLAVLASAYARAGDFVKAIYWQQQAIKLNHDTDNEKEFQQHLQLYEVKKPYTDTAPKPSKLKQGKRLASPLEP